MSVITETRRLTAEEYLVTPGQEQTELIRGEIVTMSPPGMEHGALAQVIAAELHTWNRRAKAGLVTTEVGFVLHRDPDTVRAPDVSFIVAARVPRPLPTGFAELAPDLAVEVVSPHDRAADVYGKLGEWLDAGVQAVWVIWPQRRCAWILRPAGDPQILQGGDALEDADLLPGFALSLDELFAVLD